MKVLFLGEYSGVFLELSKGLNKLGIETFRISSGDSFKKYSADFLINNKKKSRINSVLSSFLGFSNLFDFIRLWPELRSKINDYDIVQLINPRFFPFGDLINMYILYRKRGTILLREDHAPVARGLHSLHGRIGKNTLICNKTMAVYKKIRTFALSIREK